MAERKKLELQLNQPVNLELLFDEPVVGESKYGAYYLYAVKTQDGEEYSFFAPDVIHDTLKTLKKGDRASLTKTAEQSGSKILTKYDVQAIPTDKGMNKVNPEQKTYENGKDSYFHAMMSSYEDAIKIQEKLNGMVDVNRIAITLFIARSKVSGNGLGG